MGNCVIVDSSAFKVVDDVWVFGLDNAVKGSKYPMVIDTKSVNADIVDRTHALATVPTGTGHDQFLTGILVQFDLTFTVKAWTEAERYHFFDFISSQSTMHRIAKFDLDSQYIQYVDPRMIEIANELKDRYNQTKDTEDYLRLLYSNPAGFQLTAKMTTNYRQLKTIYWQRKDHRLPEWREFCKFIETLPHAEFIVGTFDDGCESEGK